MTAFIIMSLDFAQGIHYGEETQSNRVNNILGESPSRDERQIRIETTSSLSHSRYDLDLDGAL